jgi:hypothetical protein
MSVIHIYGRIVVAALACLVASGCATYDRTKAAPAQTEPIALHFTHDSLGLNDLPLGAYRVPESEVIVSGHQTTGGIGMAFGLVGVLVSDAIDSHRGANAVGTSEKVLQLRIDDEARRYIETQLASEPLQRKFTWGKGVDKTLDITPAVVLTFVDDLQARAYVELKVALKDASGQSTWDTRYFASTGTERRLAGPGSWTENDGAALKASITASLAQAVKVMLADIAAPYPRDDARLRFVQARVPYVHQAMQMTGYGLVEDEHYVVFTPKIGDASVLSGVNIFDKDFIVYRAATADDKTKMLQEGSGFPLPHPVAKAASGAASSSTAAAAGTAATATATPSTAVVATLPAGAAPRQAVDSAAGGSARRADVQHLDAAMIAGKTWSYPHPRDPSRYGDVRLVFTGDRVEASNAKSHTSGSWRIRDDMLCVSLEAPDWGRICYYVVEGAHPDDGNDVQLMLVTSGKREPLRIE